MKTVKKLERALKQGYLLHGSPHFISECLKPRLSSDEDKESGNQNAVFATSNVAIAVWKAVAHKAGPGSMVGWSWDDFGKKVLFAENIELGDGYVYILPRNSFQAALDDAADHFSYDPVTPIQVVKVSFQDLLDMQSEFGFTLDIR